MNLSRLRYFLAVAKHLSITHAAAELDVEQSLLSRQVAAMEEELGVKLFIRGNKGVRLNAAGLCFYEHALILVEGYRHALNHMKHLKARQQTLNIGMCPYGGLFLEKMLPIFQKYYPDVIVNVSEYRSAEIVSQINDCLLDIAISPSAVLEYINRPIESVILSPYIAHLVAHKDHKVMKSKTQDELKNESFIAYSKETGKIFTIDVMNNCVESYFGFWPQNIISANSTSALMFTILGGNGVTFVPSSYLSKLPKHIKSIPVVPPFDIGNFILLRHYEVSNPSVHAFWNLAIKLKFWLS